MSGSMRSRAAARAGIDVAIGRAFQRARTLRRQPEFDALLYSVRCRTTWLQPRASAAAFDQEAQVILAGLLALVRHAPSWIRPPWDWQYQPASMRVGFRQLARHLLARHNPPHCFDAVWLDPQQTSAPAQQWYIRLAAGQSPRSIGLPIRLTRRMSHLLMTATPDDLPLPAALRRAEWLGLGGCEELLPSILTSSLGQRLEAEDPWRPFLQWCVRWQRELLSARFEHGARLAPLLEMLASRRLGMLAAGAAARGSAPRGSAPPIDPFDGLNPAELWDRVSSWRNEVWTWANRGPGSPPRPLRPVMPPFRPAPCPPINYQWPRSTINEFEYVESPATKSWAISELLSSQALRDEGTALRHCVAAYDGRCVQRKSTIWSLHCTVAGVHQRVLTLEVDPGSRTLVQARGTQNARPDRQSLAWQLVLRWAALERLQVCPRILV